MLAFFFDNYMLRFGETFSTMFMEEFVQSAWRLNGHQLIELEKDAELTCCYDILSIAKYEKLSHECDMLTGASRILYRWILRLKHGFDLVYQVEEKKDEKYAEHEMTMIEIQLYLRKNGMVLRTQNDIETGLDPIDQIALRNLTPLLDFICASCLSGLHYKLDVFNEEQRKQQQQQRLKQLLIRTPEMCGSYEQMATATVMAAAETETDVYYPMDIGDDEMAGEFSSSSVISA